jgi:hypothetical protein
VEIPAEIDPGVEGDETRGQVLALGEQNGNHRKIRPRCFEMESVAEFGQLPLAQAMRPIKHNHGLRCLHVLFQARDPILAGDQIVLIEESPQPTLMKPRHDSAGALSISTIVAYEDIVILHTLATGIGRMR